MHTIWTTSDFPLQAVIFERRANYHMGVLRRLRHQATVSCSALITSIRWIYVIDLDHLTLSDVQILHLGKRTQPSDIRVDHVQQLAFSESKETHL
jgi:hypothetical protein